MTRRRRALSTARSGATKSEFTWDWSRSGESVSLSEHDSMQIRNRRGLLRPGGSSTVQW